MSLLQIIEEQAEMILNELKARCVHLANAYGKNAHSHINPIVSALEAHVEAKTPVQAPAPVEEAAPVAAPESVVAEQPAPAEPAPAAPAEQATVAAS